MLVERAGFSKVSSCLDSNCGDGSLLEAVARQHVRVRCMGLDMDGAIVRALHRRHPTWVLSEANALTRSAWTRTRAGLASKNCDLVMLNPPFSMTKTRGVTASIGGRFVRCSIAMAHVAIALQMSSAGAACAIVPESLMSSELDASARSLVRLDYTWEVLGGLRNSTFHGARANALMIAFVRRPESLPLRASQHRRVEVPFLLRGGLPVHEARYSKDGIPFLHSTDQHRPLTELRRVRAIDRGLLAGHAILIPRVGVPSRPLPILHALEQVQLSDCVIAIQCANSRHAQLVANAIEVRWRSFAGLWRGTGARYVTMERLERWCLGNILTLYS